MKTCLRSLKDGLLSTYKVTFRVSLQFGLIAFNVPFHCEKHCNLLQILLGKPSVTYKFYFLASNKDMNEGAFLMIHNEFVNFFSSHLLFMTLIQDFFFQFFQVLRGVATSTFFGNFEE